MSTSGSSNQTSSYTNGTGANKLNKLHEFTYTITPSTRVSLNLIAAGPGLDITDPEGYVLSFTIIREIFIYLRPNTAAARITIGGGTDGAGANAFTGGTSAAFGGPSHTNSIGNGSYFHVGRPDATGYPVIANNVLALFNNDAALNAIVDVVIVGEG